MMSERSCRTNDVRARLQFQHQHALGSLRRLLPAPSVSSTATSILLHFSGSPINCVPQLTTPDAVSSQYTGSSTPHSACLQLYTSPVCLF